ncbi:MAG: efflux transporter outer membrane subunit [Burkholderiales bacterium]|nr:efflux transporter outer membrane subunit [Burkholderiales bacterium]
MNYSYSNYVGRRTWLATLVGVALAGCATLPPKDAAPKLDTVEQADFAKAGNGAWPAADWWKQFGDAQLDTLIEHALANSPNMAVAQARVAQASAESRAVAAEGGINVAADAQVSRQLYSKNSIYPPPLGGSYDTSGDMRLDFSYDFDFWGRNRSAIEAALGQRAAAQAEVAGAAASLSAAVAHSYYQWQALNAHIASIESIEAQRGALVQLEARRVKAGIVSGDNLHPLVADAAAPHQTLVQLQTQREQAAFQLKSLVGGDRNMPALKAVPLPTVKAELPSNLPIDLLARRPDIAAARDRVQASLKQVDSARAAFYPDISITAFAGANSLYMGKLLHASSRELGVTPALHLPLFDAGRLRAGLDENRADVTMAVAQYDQALQAAVADVNDAVVRLNGAEAERASLDKQLQSRQRDLDGANKRLKAGLADRREVLRDQLSLTSVQDQEINRRVQALSAQVDLIKALGGGYVAPEQAAQQ